jgi:3-phytase
MFPHPAIVTLTLLAFAPVDHGSPPADRPAAASKDAARRVLAPPGKATIGPVPSAGDAADDPAIWVHPSRPERSLLLATDKRGGLLVYEFDGDLHQVVADGSRPNNVDVLYDFVLGGVPVDLAVASCTAEEQPGVKVWVIEPSTRKLVDALASPVFAVFGGETPYGLCVYRSRVTGKSYFVVTHKQGRVEQWELFDDRGRLAAKRVRELKLGSTAEGCVADDEHGALFLAEEDVGIWKVGAEPGDKAAPELIAKVGEHGLAKEVEGLTLYCASNGQGYLIASSQGNNSFKVYDRGGEHRYLFTIDPRPGRHDDVEQTDGLAVTNAPISREFPKGVLVLQDGHNTRGNQDFHLYAWEDVAGGQLIVDTRWSPRTRKH